MLLFRIWEKMAEVLLVYQLKNRHLSDGKLATYNLFQQSAYIQCDGSHTRNDCFTQFYHLPRGKKNIRLRGNFRTGVSQVCKS
jgi:hypothetical protein